ncbi:MAG TPA: GNAT family N-acetyltransferase [Thermomicrobiales bacterium]|nr:GNAT family N-acetyltransferase [Thermomicrobiales bacterium]
MTASQAANGDASPITADELRSDWSGIDLATASLVVRDPSGAIAGYADVDNRANVVTSVYAYVAPAFRGQGVGTALRHWGDAYARQAMLAAPADLQAVVQQFIPSPAASARDLLEAAGYRAVRETFVMETALARPLPNPDWPEAIAVRSFVPGHDDRATFEAVEDAFRDLWGRPRGTFERFEAMIAAPGFDPALWLLALDGDEIAATGLARSLSDEGWIDVIGVRRPWRRRGIGLALLHSLFAVLKECGSLTAALSVDAESATGAPRLYRRAGMTVRASYLRYRKELRPGRDAAELAGDP